MPNSKLITLLIVFIAFTSCDRNGVYEENIDSSKNIWAKSDIATLVAPINDTLSPHNIMLNIRNTTDYPNSNLFLFIAITSPAGVTQLDTVECFLADDQGKWLGKGFGFIRDNQVPFKRNVRFPIKGDYKFEIKQAMRTDSLVGIASVGIRIEKSKR